MDTLTIAIVGHIDHGKSTLIGRLLYETGSIPESLQEELGNGFEESERGMNFAFLLDHLEEERQKRITIDTSQVFFQGKKRKYIIIDTPGHKEFLKNTITGCCQAEAAVLLIDASEGICEQTRRHGYILSLLGIKHVVVAINKMDLVECSQQYFQKISRQAVDLLNELGIQNQDYIIPVSAKHGENITTPPETMPWFRGPSILDALEKQKPRPLEKKEFRLPIQGIFEINGEKIIMGRIESGRLQAGRRLRVLPQDKWVVLKDIKKFGEESRETYGAGESVGITIDGNVHLKRGDVFVEDGKARALQSIKAAIFWFAESPFQPGDLFLMRCATQEAYGKIAKIYKQIDPGQLEIKKRAGRNDKINHGEIAEIRIDLERPIVVDPFHLIPEMGRFTLEVEKIPFAGGIVTTVN